MRVGRYLALGLLLASSSAYAVEDWRGIVNIQAAYGDSSTGPITEETTIEVLYSGNGSESRAWGTLRWTAEEGERRAYAHAVCIGRLNNHKNLVVTGRIVKRVPDPSGFSQNFISFELDIANKRIRVIGHDTEAQARANCDEQTGIFPGVFVLGHIVVK